MEDNAKKKTGAGEKFPASGSLRIFLDGIEAKRGSRRFGDRLAVAVKDIFWVFSFYIPFNIFEAGKRVSHRIFMAYRRQRRDCRQTPDRYRRISFCITCMGRLGHLKKTLRRNLRDNRDYPDLEFVLLDYNSQDGLAAWVRKNFGPELASGRLALYRTEEPRFFEMAKAKNLAHRLASGEAVCNLDADNYTGKDFAFFINLAFSGDRHPIGFHGGHGRAFSAHVSDCGGRIFLSKEDFLAIGGYDEGFQGWGLEDVEFIRRARNNGLESVIIPQRFLGAIRHSRKIRFQNMEIGQEKSLENNGPRLGASDAEKRLRVDNHWRDLNRIIRIR